MCNLQNIHSAQQLTATLTLVPKTKYLSQHPGVVGAPYLLYQHFFCYFCPPPLISKYKIFFTPTKVVRGRGVKTDSKVFATLLIFNFDIFP